MLIILVVGLVVGGIIFFLLPVAGQLVGEIRISKERQRLTRIVGASLLSCGMITLLIALYEPPPPPPIPRETTTAPSPPTHTLPQTDTSIVIWKVGSPHRGDTPENVIPLDLLLAAEELGYQLEMETFPAEGFAQRFFDAFLDNVEPDILAFDNYGIIEGITTDLGDFAGIGSSETVRDSLVFVSGSFESLASEYGGWQVLVSTSRHHVEAKSLALREAECPPPLQAQTSAGIAETELDELARAITVAFLGGSNLELERYFTGAEIISASSRGEPAVVENTAVCAILGNPRLVFVNTLATFETPGHLGQALLFFLLEEQAGWHIVTISDPLTTGELSRVTDLLVPPTSDTADQPQPAVLLAPEDGSYPQPEGNDDFGYFEWEPSPSSNVIAEVAEFSYGAMSRLFFRPRSEQVVTKDMISAGQLFSGVAWQWRILSISKDGSIAFSDVRSFEH